MKKIYRLSLLAASLLVASTTSFAAASYKGEAVNYKDQAPCPQPLMLKDGFYVGGQLGYDSYRVRANNTTTQSVGGTSYTVSTNPALAATGWVGGLFLGYGQYFNNMGYLGLEVFGNDSGASTSYTTTLNSLSYNDKVTVNGSYGISLLPGMKLNDATLGYIRLGYNRARIKGSETLSTPTGSPSASNSNWSSGFNYGLGVETAFYENWSARTEFTHTNYQSFSSSLGTSYNPSDNQFMLGLIYHFA